jgi:predicted P-loop ATPase
LLKDRGNGRWELIFNGEVVRVTDASGPHASHLINRMTATERIVLSRLTDCVDQDQTAQQILDAIEELAEYKNPEKGTGKYLPIGVLQEVAQLFWMPQLNTRTMLPETRFGVLTEVQMNVIDQDFQQATGLTVPRSHLEAAILMVAEKNKFDPVVDLLEEIASSAVSALSTKEWEQVALLAFGNADPFASLVLQRWFIQAVARGFDPGCKGDTCPVIYGPQGAGKSTFFEIIGGPFFTDGIGATDNVKDDLLVLTGAWIAEYSEADRAFKGANASEKIKAFVTRRIDAFRPPYARNVMQVPRATVLCGTTNRDDWATDPTGNRRFPVIKTDRVDTDWVRVNRERIIKKAIEEYRAGTPWHYSAAEEQQITRGAADYAADDPIVDDAMRVLSERPGVKHNTAELYHAVTGESFDEVPHKDRGYWTRKFKAVGGRGGQTAYEQHNPANPSYGGRGRQRIFWI